MSWFNAVAKTLGLGGPGTVVRGTVRGATGIPFGQGFSGNSYTIQGGSGVLSQLPVGPDKMQGAMSMSGGMGGGFQAPAFGPGMPVKTASKMQGVMSAIRGEQGMTLGSLGQPAAQPEMVMVQAPSGEQRQMPRHMADQAVSRGAVLVR